MPAGDYERGKTLGEGTYGIVFQAIRLNDDTPVAVKRIKSEKKVRAENEGLNITALREIKYLRELHHPNIIQVPL
jgi:cyclin-dependent kinase 7